MAQQQTIRDAARNLAAADLLQKISTEEKVATIAEELRNMPDDALQIMSRMSGIPAHHTDLHVAMMRGQENEFSRGLNALDGWFQPGDII